MFEGRKLRSNGLVPMKVHPYFRNWTKMEAAKRGKSIIEFSEEFGKENLERLEMKNSLRVDNKNGFKINF